MDIEYLINLWKNSENEIIMIKSLPLARGTDKIIIEPTMVLEKDEKIMYGKELICYDYLRLIFKNSIFEYIESKDVLIVKEIYRRNINEI